MTLRRVSLKRAALNRQVQPVRDALVAEVERCEWCGRYYSLSCHEISRGSARSASLTARCAILVLCNLPHGTKPSCHVVVGAWSRAKQLALLYLRRPGEFDLQAYHKLIDRNKPDQAEVDAHVQVLIGQGAKT